MTCIVGIVDQENNRVVMGADSAGADNYDVTIRKDLKIFKVGKFVIGCTSSFRMIQLIRFSFYPPEVGSMDIYEYMCTAFIHCLRGTLKDGGFLQKENEEESAGTFLVGYQNRLFQIHDDLQVAESVKNYDACGSGKYYALGSLWTTDNLGTSSENRVRLALECAEEFSGESEVHFIT